ncbi:DUF5131 family protein [Nonomuraea antri]|uniref:DUF5131 family protein n=1 Tax=Nonomuraea antri TaxID=2730852 RepID=UPI001C2C5470|nr:DUF5131 family protein [Nonomuraea antri]
MADHSAIEWLRSPDGRRGATWNFVVGGEFSPSAGPMHPDWPRSLRDQCTAAGVPFFLKLLFAIPVWLGGYSRRARISATEASFFAVDPQQEVRDGNASIVRQEHKTDRINRLIGFESSVGIPTKPRVARFREERANLFPYRAWSKRQSDQNMS